MSLFRSLIYTLCIWLIAAQAVAPALASPAYAPYGGLALTTTLNLSCTGGSITTSGANTIHTFNSSSSLVCTGAGTVNYLIVGGGGGAAGGSFAGGTGGSGIVVISVP